jgi:signal transduction histidine kinase
MDASGEGGFDPATLGRWRLAFAAGMLVLVIAIGWVGHALVGAIAALRTADIADIGWNASQLEVQLVKVQHLLAEAKAGNPQRLLLQRRWDNLLSRIPPLDAAVTADLRAVQPDFAPTLADIKSQLADMQAYVRVRNGNLVQSVDVLEGPATALAVPVRRLAVMAVQYWDLYIERHRSDLVNKIAALAVLSAGLLLLVAVNQAVIVSQHRRLRVAGTALRGALEMAEAAGRAKTNFMARMSHELRTPLNAIIGFSDIMQREMLGALGQAQYRDYAAGILSAGRNLLGLVDSVLDVSRLEAGTLPVTQELVELDALARGCIDRMAAQAREHSVDLTSAMPEDLPRLRIDPAHLTKILLQLLDNAVKFAPAGCRVELGARHGDGRLEIWVKDNGAGIAPEDLAGVLQPFSQVRNHLVFHGEGLGLGLPIAKSLTELNGGEFELSSTPGQGTEARLRFVAAA